MLNQLYSFQMKIKILLLLPCLLPILRINTAAIPEKNMRNFENVLEEIGDALNAVNPGSVKMPEPKMEEIMEMASNILAAVSNGPGPKIPTPLLLPAPILLPVPNAFQNPYAYIHNPYINKVKAV